MTEVPPTPPSVLIRWWCPRCGRTLDGKHLWHIRLGTLSERCTAPLTDVKYLLAKVDTMIEMSPQQQTAVRNRLAFELFDDEGCVGADPDRFGGREEADALAYQLTEAVRQALELPGSQPSTWRQVQR